MRRALFGLLMQAGLSTALFLATRLPSRAAYLVADLLGAARFRSASGARRQARLNLARVCVATGRPVEGTAVEDMVRRLFVNHARYYLELLRATQYPIAGIDRQVEVVEAAAAERLLASGGTVAVSAHLGSPEPAGVWLAKRGVRITIPMEVINPVELLDFYQRHRAGGRTAQLVPRARARRAALEAVARGELVVAAADRDLDGTGVPVTLFGHQTTMPVGPAALVLMSGAQLAVGACRRTARDRFRVTWEVIDPIATGDRRADAEELTRRIGQALEQYIAEAPEEWWGALQPIWPDLQATER